MSHSNGAPLPLVRKLITSCLVVLVVMGFCEWTIATLSPTGASLAHAVTRVLLATALVGITSYLLLRRKQRLTNRLAAMLLHRDTLNKQYQQELRERQAAEQVLSEQLRFLQILTDAIPAPIFYKDADGIYTGCNRAFEAFLGKPRDEIVGRSVYGVSPGPQARIYHEKDLELMHQRGHQVYESTARYADGTLHDVIFNKAAYELEDGRLGGLIGVILDITERKALERDLIQAKEKAEFYSRSKTQFLTNMSHEIRTPLNAIVGFSQVLRNRSTACDLPPDFHDFLGKIAISGQRLAELVNDVLDISRIEAGKLEVVNEDFRLADLIHCIVVSCEPQAVRQCLQIRCDIDPGLPEFICTDRGKLSQILINLLANAIKFSPADSTVELSLKKQHDTQLSITVTDRGIGISAAQQAIIFEPFEQVDKSLQGQLRGTGLGLPISRRLAELLGGSIGLESNPQTGTCFSVLLPLHTGKPVAPLENFQQTSIAARADIRVLIFEDNALNQVLMQAFCDDLKVSATFVADGREGIEKAAAMRPDLIFMDVQLSGLSGIEATREIRQHPALCDTPIIGLSAAAFSDQQSAALDAGMNDYLTKPVAFPQLLSVINRHLAGRPTASEIY